MRREEKWDARDELTCQKAIQRFDLHPRPMGIPDDIDQIANSINNVQRLEFPDFGHLIPLENPNEFAMHLNQFAKKLR